MKTRYFFITLCAVAAAVIFAGCSDTNAIQGYLDSFKISQSYVYFEEMDGTNGPITLDVTATDDWYVTESDIPDWLHISPLSGSAGETTLTLTADAVDGSDSAEIEIRVGTNATGGWVYKDSQFLHVSIGEVVVQEATILEVLNGTVGATYLVSGTVTRIASTSYGNFYMADEEGNSLYIYGTVDDSGAYNWASFDIEVGDYVTVQGPMSIYNSTVELVDAKFISRVKNLISVYSEAPTIPQEGGEAIVKLLVSGDGWNVDIPAEDRDWLSVASTSGTDTLSVVFYAQYNDGGDRSSTVTFSTERSGDKYTTETTITQKGSIVEATVEEIINGVEGATYTLTGYITSITNTTYGNYYVQDYTGSIQIYGTLDANGNATNFESLGISAGDIITVTGPLTFYNGTTPELQNVTVEDFKHVTDITVADFNAAEESTEVWYRLTGTVTEIASATYGNLYLSDDTAGDPLYVYGLASGWGGGNTSFQDLDVASGDVITIVGNRGSYGSTIEAMNSFYVTTVSKGAYTEATAEEINNGEDGTYYRLTGYISSMASTVYGNYYVTDYTGTVYVYGTLDADGNSKNFESLGINEGDIVTVTGPRSTYGTTVELVDVSVDKFYNVIDATVAEFNAAAVSTEVWYRITGEISSISNAANGNIYIKDSAGDELYLYGLAVGYGGSYTGFSSLGVDVGDTITFVANRGVYGSTIEATNAFWVATQE